MGAKIVRTTVLGVRFEYTQYEYDLRPLRDWIAAMGARRRVARRKRYLLRELKRKQDAGDLAILATSHLVRALELRLKLYFLARPIEKWAVLLKGTSLSDFSAKIEYAKKLKVITTEESKLLDDIRKIRNEFAHSTETPRDQVKKFYSDGTGILSWMSSWMDEIKVIRKQKTGKYDLATFRDCLVYLIITIESNPVRSGGQRNCSLH
jgi:hypothetical protein